MIKKIDQIVERFSFYSIVVCVYGMLLLTVLNIVLRWFNMSIMWIDPLVRHLVFLSAFLGGALATGNDRHIRIDLVSKLLEKLKKDHLKIWLERIICFVAMIATIMLTHAGINFAKMEFEFGKEVFLGVHSGLMVSIIPFGMGIIFLRYLFRLLLTFSKAESEVIVSE